MEAPQSGEIFAVFLASLSREGDHHRGSQIMRSIFGVHGRWWKEFFYVN